MIDVSKAGKILRLAVAIALGDRQDAARVALELTWLAVDLVPVKDLKEFLTDRDRLWADFAADIAEEAKLSGRE